MFSVNNIMKDVCMPQRSCHNNNNNMSFPCFDDIGSSHPDSYGATFNPSGYCQSGFGSVFNGLIQGDVSAHQQMAGMCAPIAHVFQMTSGMNRNKSDEKENHCQKGQGQGPNRISGKNRSTMRDQEKQQKTVSHPTVQDIVAHAMSVMHELNETTQTSKWQQRVDCSGFKSKNIKVKIDGHKLLLKAFKKHESENGVRTMSMRKNVPLPENVNTKKIKCKLSEEGFMMIEAPYLDERESDNRHISVKELMKLVVPGLENLVQTIHGLTDEQEKENEVEKCTEKKSGSNENEKTDHSDLKPENVEVEENNDKKQSNENDTGNVEKNDDKVDKAIEEDKLVFEVDTMSQPQSPSMVIGTDYESPVLSSCEDANATHEPIITFPTDNDHKPKSEDDDDLASNASEDSFVLLSVLEKENNNDQSERNKENSTILQENEKMDDSVISRQKTSTSQSYYDAHESNEPVLFRLEMPSYNPESMNVTFDNAKRLLSISASKDQNKPGSVIPQETITKTVAIDDDVDVDGLQCYFRDGTLTVTGPRKVDIRNIPIKA